MHNATFRRETIIGSSSTAFPVQHLRALWGVFRRGEEGEEDVSRIRGGLERDSDLERGIDGWPRLLFHRESRSCFTRRNAIGMTENGQFE